MICRGRSFLCGNNIEKAVPSITDSNITRFCRYVLKQFGGRDIGFVDIGSGGDLKAPWNLLPKERLATFNFEPTHSDGRELPLCISDKTGAAPFYLAKDQRASSLHKPLADFIDRFGFDSMLTKETITVGCVSLDDHFAGRYESVDAMDINVEGHDFQVLQGANKLLTAGAVKLLKVEFELIPVYEGQGYFSDIDAFLRARQFRLANIQIEHVRPAKVRHMYHEGESIWGKALYTPTRAGLTMRLGRRHESEDRIAIRRELASAVALYIAARLPGCAYDVIEYAESTGVMTVSEGRDLQRQIDSAFCWAKLEAGLSRVRGLASSTLASVLRKK